MISLPYVLAATMPTTIMALKAAFGDGPTTDHASARCLNHVGI